MEAREDGGMSCSSDEGTDNSPMKGQLDDANDIVVYAKEGEFFVEGDEEGIEPCADQEELERRASADVSKLTEMLPDVSVATNSDASDSVCCVDCARVSIDQVLIAVGSCDERCRVYCFTVSSRTLTLLCVLSEFRESVVSVAFSHDAKFLAAASYDSTVRIYNVTSNEKSDFLVELAQTLEGPSLDVEFVRWHPKGYAVIAGSKDLTAWMWWATTGRTMAVLTGHGGPVLCGTYASSGRSIVTGSSDGSVIVWNPKTGEKIHGFSHEGTRRSASAPITCLAAQLSTPMLAFGSEDGTIVLLNVDSGRVLATLEGHTDSVESLEFLQWENAPATYLISGSLDGTVRVWDCSRFVCRSVLKHSDASPTDGNSGDNDYDTAPFVGGVTRVRVLPESSRLVSAGTDCTLRIWDARDAECIQVLSGHKDTILDVATVSLACGATLIASCSDDNSLKDSTRYYFLYTPRYDEEEDDPYSLPI